MPGFINEVTGSKFRDVAQFGRVLGLGPRCRRFKSCHLDQFLIFEVDGECALVRFIHVTNLSRMGSYKPGLNKPESPFNR